MASISIAMATYNGEPYIKEQLESLSEQIRLPEELVVCDDGSTDNTLAILKEFSKKAPFPVRIYENEINLGYSENFFKAATLCKSNYISFCDQDDVWLPNKVEEVHAAIERNNDAIMVLQNAYICKADLSHEGRIFPNRLAAGSYPPRTQYGFWVWPGFLKTINADMLSLLALCDRPLSYFPKDGVQTHDKWTCMIANAIGQIIVLAEPVALYRRHDDALTGPYKKKGLKRRIKNSSSVGSDHYAFLSKVASSTAEYLWGLASKSQSSWSENLRLSGDKFEILARIQRERSNLYEAQTILSRISCLFKIASRGGYIGSPMLSLGWKSMMKDIIQTFGYWSNPKL